MGRKKKGSVLEKDELNVTPLIDCVFLLLIFFMVTTVFDEIPALEKKLPEAEYYDQIQERQIIAELDANSNIAVNSRITSFEEFDALLQNEKQRSGITTLLINGDVDAKYSDLVNLMRLAKTVGIDRTVVGLGN